MIMNCKMVFTSFMLFLATTPFMVSARCDLWRGRGSRFVNKDPIVHSSFRAGVARIHKFAVACGVKVYVTSSFRKDGVPVRGAIVSPAKRSNHLVGHAIDMNLKEGSKHCNSKCLLNPPVLYRGVRCFIKKIRDDGSLRWGGDFQSKPDPVHIDDHLNNDRPLYERLYKELQTNCAHIDIK